MKAAKKKLDQNEYPSIFIPLEEFDKTRLIVQTPRKVTGGGVVAIKSRYLYKQDDGGVGIPYISVTGQNCFINQTHPFEDKEAGGGKQQPESSKSITGYQMSYPLTSWKTRTEPTPAEITTKALIDEIIEATKEQVPAYANIKYPETDELVFSSKDMRKGLLNLDDSRLKPLYGYPALKDQSGKKIMMTVGEGDDVRQIPKPDTSKSQSMYIKMLTFGKDADLKIYSKMYDVDAKELDIRELAGKSGFVDQPILKLADVYYGKSSFTDYIAFPQIKFVSGIFEEIEFGSVPDFKDRLFKPLSSLVDKPVDPPPTQSAKPSDSSGDASPKKKAQTSQKKSQPAGQSNGASNGTLSEEELLRQQTKKNSSKRN
jgi:hypothetical protein